MSFRHLIVSSTLARFITGYPRICLISTLLLTVLLTPFLFSVKTIDNVDYFTLENDPNTLFYKGFKNIFGNDEFFVIAFEPRKGFTAGTLQLLREITEELEGIEEAQKVTSLANVDDTIGSSDYFEVKGFLQEIPSETNEVEKLKNRAIENPLYVGNFISRDGKVLAILVEAYERDSDEEYRKRLIDKTEAILDKYRDAVGEFHLAGWTVTNLRLSQYLQADLKVFVPVTYTLIIVIVWSIFRSAILTLLAFINITFCIVCTGGFMGMLEVTLNNVTCIVIPLTMALSLCDTVHIFSRLDSRVFKEHSDREKALNQVLAQVISPCFLTTLTTAVGFLSLAVSEIPPIRQFGWIASAGMVFEFIFSFFLLPPLLLFCSPEKIYHGCSRSTAIRRLVMGLHGFAQANHRWIVGVMTVLVLGSCWFTTRVSVETNLVEFFKKSSPVRTSINFVEEHLAGVSTVDISLKASHRDAFKKPDHLSIIEKIQQEIHSIKGVDKTVSLVDFIKDMNESFHDEDRRYYAIPESENLISQYLLLYDSDRIEDVINSEYDHARILLRLSQHGSAAQEKIIREINNRLSQIDHRDINITVTGRVVNDVNLIDALVRGQVYSLGIAALVVSLIMFMVMGSASGGVLSLIPNLFPIILNFGIMGASGISLSTGTAVIATVSLGIAVDDTIHFLSEYLSLRKSGLPLGASLEAVFSNKGEAILSSSIILCIGFGVLVLSRFGPIVYFGLLTSLIMVTAVIGDLVLLPSFMLLRGEMGFGDSEHMKIQRNMDHSAPLQ